MALFGYGVYHAAGLFKDAKTQIRRPTAAAAPALPGTMYLEQAGAIYRFEKGAFRQITSEAGWMQPSPSADGTRLVAAKRTLNRSDLYVLTSTGRVLLQLTDNKSSSVEGNHWSFYPRFSADSSTVYFSYDPKDRYNNYRVDFAIYATTATSPSAAAVDWSYPNEYTGGDIQPVPLQKHGVLYTKFSIDDQSNIHSQVWLQSRPDSPGIGLTKPGDDCSQPALSKDETVLAMVCRHGGLQSANLEVAPLDVAALKLGAPTVLVQGQLVASPTFSPDGKLLSYLAPGEAGGPFQLWAADPSATTVRAPRQITTSLDLDPTSAPAWTTG